MTPTGLGATSIRSGRIGYIRQGHCPTSALPPARKAPIDDIAAVPAPDDDAEWDRLSLHHYDQCEWIRTAETRLRCNAGGC